MRKKLSVVMGLFLSASLALAGCGNAFVEEDAVSSTAEEVGYDPYAITILTQDDLEYDTYYIKHGDDFYEIPFANCNFSNNYILDQTTPDGDPTRCIFYTKNETEKLIPTVYAGDEIVYRSQSEQNGAFEWERFIDAGYTLGISNMSENSVGTLSFNNLDSNILDDTLVAKVLGNPSDSSSENYHIYNLDTINGVKMTDKDLSEAGFILSKRLLELENATTSESFKSDSSESFKDDFFENESLEGESFSGTSPEGTKSTASKEISSEESAEGSLVESNISDLPFEVDFYLGTELYRANLDSEARVFTNFENFWTNNLEYEQTTYISIQIPDFFPTGYYKINSSGMFRYVALEYDENISLSEQNYNKSYFKVDEEGNLVYKKDEDGNYIYK